MSPPAETPANARSDRAKLPKPSSCAISPTRPQAFSSEVATGSREENASKQKPGARFWFDQNRIGPGMHSAKMNADVTHGYYAGECTSCHEPGLLTARKKEPPAPSDARSGRDRVRK